MEPTTRQPVVRKHVIRVRTSLGTVQILWKCDTAEEAQQRAEATKLEVVSITEEDVRLDF